MGAQSTGLVEGRCHGVGGRVLFKKLCRKGCRVCFRISRRVLFRVGGRVLFRIVRSASLRVVRRLEDVWQEGACRVDSRTISGCVLCTLGWQKGFSSSLLRNGSSVQTEERKIQVIWQREYGKRRLIRCTILYKTGKKDYNSQRSTRFEEL
jgi:hypothetical protein